MSDPFRRDGKLSARALREAAAHAEGARRHGTGTSPFYTAPDGGVLTPIDDPTVIAIVNSPVPINGYYDATINFWVINPTTGVGGWVAGPDIWLLDANS